MLSKNIEDEITRLIHSKMLYYDVPGLNIMIASFNEILYSGGYGYRDVSAGLNTDKETLVYIASATKAFTALSCAILVEQGKLAWNRPLIEYIPSFETADVYITQNATIVDLLSHRTGIKEFSILGQDGISRSDLLAELKNNPPSKPFRAVWQYNNSLYGVVGQIVEIISGESWEDFTKEHIFVPLEMTDSDFSFVLDWPHMNRSKLYVKQGSNIEIFVPPKTEINQYDACGPAGSINSNALDMGKWLTFLLNRGAYRSKRLISKENFDMLTAPHCITDMEPESGKEHFSTACYALGWVNQWYKGRHIIWHNGSFGSFVSFLPNEQIGISVVPNIDSPLGRELSYEIYDLLSSTVYNRV